MWWLLHAIEMPVLTKSTGRPLPNNQRLHCGLPVLHIAMVTSMLNVKDMDISMSY